ncbi:aldehyde dehydrogenase family protein, partial [Streptomyces collinus]
MAPTLTASPLTRKAGTSWPETWQHCLAAAPEAFRDDRVLNLWNAGWHADGRVLPATSPVDGTPIAGPPRL